MRVRSGQCSSNSFTIFTWFLNTAFIRAESPVTGVYVPGVLCLSSSYIMYDHRCYRQINTQSTNCLHTEIKELNFICKTICCDIFGTSWQTMLLLIHFLVPIYCKIIPFYHGTGAYLSTCLPVMKCLVSNLPSTPLLLMSAPASSSSLAVFATFLPVAMISGGRPVVIW